MRVGSIGFSKSMAREVASRGITVNAIAPGPILPAVNSTKKEQTEVIKQTPLKRLGGAEEITKAIRFLIESDFVTGECIRVDGGRHLY